MIILVGKPMVVGYQHFREPPYRDKIPTNCFAGLCPSIVWRCPSQILLKFDLAFQKPKHEVEIVFAMKYVEDVLSSFPNKRYNQFSCANSKNSPTPNIC